MAAHDMAVSPAEEVDEDSPEEEEWEAAPGPEHALADSPDDENNNNASGLNQHSRVPMQKRRRVTRACDECRRKKIKCDGKQPCTHCTVYSYDCTYDQPSHRRRNPGPQYVEALELRLHRAEALLRSFVPDLDIYHPSLDAALQQGYVPSPYPRINQSNYNETEPGTLKQRQNSRQMQPQDPDLESMVRASGQLDIDERGYWDYHGPTSGLSFLRRMREQFGELDGPEQTAKTGLPYSKDRRHYLLEASGTFRSPSSHSDSSFVGTEDLPTRELALRLCGPALDDATAILRPIHQPSFYKQLDRIYMLSPDQYENSDHKFLPLLYTVLAVGCLFAKDGASNLEMEGYQSATDEGYKYFWAARELMDITDCRDLTSLQAVIFMILFLQCSAKLSTCYSYVGVAQRSALRLGLHRSFQENFNPIELEVRKRVFWTIRKMDIYCAALLGLPQTLSNDDIDQDYPSEVDDELITENEIKPMPSGTNALIAGANANYKLNNVISKIVRNIYPIKGAKDRDPSRTYSVSYATIREIENDLQSWMEDLPPSFRPCQDAPPTMLRIQQLLRMSYAHAQMMLYRPFLHYLSANNPAKVIDQRSYACAAACVSVSQNIIHITTDMKRRGLLIGSYWFTMYTTFFGILSLVYFVLENPENAARQDVMRDAREGKETLAGLAKRSAAADRCTTTLNVLFEHISSVVDDGTGQQVKMESGESPEKTANTQPAAAANSNSDLPKRANTIPHVPPQASSKSNIATRPRRAATASSQKGGGGRKRGKNQQPDLYSPTASSNANTQANFASFDSSHISQTQNEQHARIQPPQQHLPQQSPTAAQYGGQPQPGYISQEYAQSGFQGELSHMSAMMFPSGDPFAYPNQPMTTLEQNHASPGSKAAFQHDYGGNMFVPPDSAAASSGNVSANDQIDAQFFGPLPPYMHQSHQHARMGSYGAPSMMENEGHTGPTPTSGPELWNQARTHGLPGMNLDNIFGDDAWGNLAPDPS